MKKFLCILSCLALILSFSSCHGKRVSKEEAKLIQEEKAKTEISEADKRFSDASFDDSKEYTVTFWAKNDTNIDQVNIYKKTIADFEELYPNINVELQLYTDYGRIYSDVLVNIPTGTTPDVCITYPDHIATYMTGEDVVVPLNSLMENKEYGLGGSKLKFDSPTKAEIVPQFLEECAFGSTYYALPFMRSTEACYINKDYVEKLGYTVPDVLTWDFVFEVSEAATKKDENGNFVLNGKKTLIPFIYKSTDNMMIQMLYQKKSGYSDSDGFIYIFNPDTREILNKVAESTRSGAFSTFKISGYPANFLNAGECVFAVDSTAGASWMGCDAPNIDISDEKLTKFETVVRTVPQYDPASPLMISQGPSVCIFNKKDNGQVLASWLFTQFLLTNSVQNAYSMTEGYVPVTLKAQSSDEYTDYISRMGEDNNKYYHIKIKAAKLMLDNIENTFVTPVFNGSTSLRNAAGTLIEDTVKSTRRKHTVDEAFIDGLFDKVISLYSLDPGSIKESLDLPDTPLENADNKTASSVPLPKESVILLSVIAAVWAILGICYVTSLLKKRKK